MKTEGVETSINQSIMIKGGVVPNVRSFDTDGDLPIVSTDLFQEF
jgi:hypothetical protein